MEIFNNKICVSYSDLTNGLNPIVGVSNYKLMVHRNKITVARRACRGTEALIEYESLPDKIKQAVTLKFGDIEKQARRAGLRGHVADDPKALEYFTHYRLPDGRSLPDEKIREYCLNASVLNAAYFTLNSRSAMRRSASGSVRKTWDSVAQEVQLIKDEYPHTLPENPVRLKAKLNEYMKDSYMCLISGKFCNANSRKVNAQIERLILSLYCLPEKPFSSTVHDMYLQFLSGAIDMVDVETGEIFDRFDYFNEDGTPIVVSESTIWNYLNNPKNRVLVDKRRNDSLEFSKTHRPHHIRKSPVFSFSKISMDDRDLRKMHDGKRLKTYCAYDVASECMIGVSYSRDKNTQLFIDCMRDMFKFIDRNGWGMPMEVEVEHHLVNQFADDLMKADVIFPFVRWCNPGNSQEKRAEHFHRMKKYSVEKKTQTGIGRFYAKLEANRPKTSKIFDEANNKYKEKTFSMEQIIADDQASIGEYNNSLHSNQKLYKGMTRMDVLKHNMNPNLSRINRAKLMRYLGDKTETSIRRSMYVTVQYNKYMLPTPQILARLAPNNYNVTAYYMPDNVIEEVHIYQGDEFICTCKRIEAYQEAEAEKTEADKAEYVNQAKYVAKFDKMSKEEKPAKAKVMKNLTKALEQEVQIVEQVMVQTKSNRDDDDYLLNNFSTEEMKARARGDM